jgi:hypothetical protein
MPGLELQLPPGFFTRTEKSPRAPREYGALELKAAGETRTAANAPGTVAGQFPDKRSPDGASSPALRPYIVRISVPSGVRIPRLMQKPFGPILVFC